MTSHRWRTPSQPRLTRLTSSELAAVLHGEVVSGASPTERSRHGLRALPFVTALANQPPVEVSRRRNPGQLSTPISIFAANMQLLKTRKETLPWQVSSLLSIGSESLGRLAILISESLTGAPPHPPLPLTPRALLLPQSLLLPLLHLQSQRPIPRSHSGYAPTASSTPVIDLESTKSLRLQTAPSGAVPDSSPNRPAGISNLARSLKVRKTKASSTPGAIGPPHRRHCLLRPPWRFFASTPVRGCLTPASQEPKPSGSAPSSATSNSAWAKAWRICRIWNLHAITYWCVNPLWRMHG